MGDILRVVPIRHTLTSPLSPAVKQESLRAIGAGIHQDFSAIVTDWQHKAQFKESYAPDSVTVATTDLIFRWVELGTRPHQIKAVNAPYLVFRTGYQPKTRAGDLSYRGSGIASGEWRRVKVVNHPGTAARNLRVPIAEIWKVKGREIINRVLKRK